MFSHCKRSPAFSFMRVFDVFFSHKCLLTVFSSGDFPACSPGQNFLSPCCFIFGFCPYLYSLYWKKLMEIPLKVPKITFQVRLGCDEGGYSFGCFEGILKKNNQHPSKTQFSERKNHENPTNIQ